MFFLVLDDFVGRTWVIIPACCSFRVLAGTQKRRPKSHDHAAHELLSSIPRDNDAHQATAVPQTFLQRQRVHDGKAVSRRHHFQRLTEL